MGKSNIDPIIQGKLQNFKSELDTEALWNSINGSIPTSPLAVAAPITSAAVSTIQVVKATSLLLVLTLTAGMVYYLNSSDQPQSVNQITSTTEQVNVINNTTTLAALNQDTQQNSEIAKSLSSVNETIQESSKGTESKTVTGTTDNKKSTINQVTPALTPIKTSESANHTFTLSEETSNLLQNSNNPIMVADSKKESHSTSSTANQGLQTTIYSQSQTSSILTTQTDDQSLIQISDLKSNRLYPFTGNQKNVEISLSNLAPIKDKVNCYDYSDKKPKISLLAYYGPGMTIRSLTANDTEMTNYKSAREDSEVMLENHRAGLQLKASHKSGLYGKVGIESSVINEKFSQYVETRSQEVQYGLLETIKYPDGTIKEIYGDQIVTIISRKEWKNHNKFETIDLSAFLGYEMAVNRWRYHLEAGVLYNLGTRFEGTFFDATTLLPHEAPDDYYKSKTGIDLHFAGGIGFDLTDDLTLSLSPSLRYDLKVVNESTYPLDQKYMMASLLAGAEYRF